jgi:cbb3-type cytochrome oxidase subunit 1
MAAEKKQDTLLFTKDNYLWMAIGGVVMLIGLFLMMGGKSTDPNVFNKEEIYSTRRITVAPFLIVLGLLIEIYAIMKKPKQ